ncbi:MAG: aminotransferase class I/II-fold pyridoxal phosphate-dependent enzyme [Clostridia bacterium]|nr:aminotransferase class I/II-fold pyridoxal phosphate-dependent enzyme [Clostridia bacterium]
MADSLYDYLKAYAAQEKTPMHMPGHKRKENPYAPDLPYRYDLTEIPGTDNLHRPEGIIKAMCRRAAALWGATEAIPLVNGSTAGILAAIAAAAPQGSDVIVARNSHLAVYHGLMLGRMEPHYLIPETDGECGICGPITAKAVEKLLEEYPKTGLVVITSPTYEGVISPVAEIAQTVHRHGALLLTDAAHGAHLPWLYPDLYEELKNSDLVVCGLHKTLPSLTQTALLLRFSDRVDGAAVSDQLRVYESSSPSYPLLASVDACLTWLERDGKERFDRYRQDLSVFLEKARKLKHLCLFSSAGCLRDESKIVIGTSSSRWNGPGLADELRGRFGIETEMSCRDYVLALSTVFDGPEDLERLLGALVELDEEGNRENRACVQLPKPQIACPPRHIRKDETEPVSLAQSAGRVCASFVWAYPPETPVLVPGEVIPAQFETWVRDQRASGVRIEFSSCGDDGEILVLRSR